MIMMFRRRPRTAVAVLAAMVLVLALVPAAAAKAKSKAAKIAEAKRTHDKALAEIQLMRVMDAIAKESTRVATLEKAGVARRANRTRGAPSEDAGAALVEGGSRRLRLQLAQAIGQCAMRPDSILQPFCTNLCALSRPGRQLAAPAVAAVDFPAAPKRKSSPALPEWPARIRFSAFLTCM